MKMKSKAKNSILMLVAILTITYLSCYSQTRPDNETYSEIISLQGDSKNFYLEFSKVNRSIIRWGIENSGRHRIPLINQFYDDSLKSFKGDLSFFGYNSFGKINGEFIDNKIVGELVWHGDTIAFNLKQIERKLTYTEENVSFSNGSTILKGTLIKPMGKGPFPAVIFAHGSGPATRWWGMYWAAELSKTGVATLLYDKRGCGESQGTSWVNSSLDDNALDVVSGIKLLENHLSIDKNKIGIYGVSQGGWIASKVSSIYGNLSFIIVNSGGGISPYESELHSYDTNMKFAGINEEDRKKGMSLVTKYMEYLKTGGNRPQLKELLDQNRNEPWFNILGIDRILVSEKNRENWEWVATYNPFEDIKQMKFPVLLLFGDKDFQNPSDVSIEKWKLALNEGGNKNYKIELFKGASHGLILGGHHSSGFPKYAENHIETINKFIEEYVKK